MYDYPFIIKPLSQDDGGGYLIEYPDLPGCFSDGDTHQEAIENGQEALESWMIAAKMHGTEIPKPILTKEYSGQFRQRIPKSLHQRLAWQAKIDNVSINQLVTSFIAKGLQSY